jgi:vancomycin resistance protein YoaR
VRIRLTRPSVGRLVAVGAVTLALLAYALVLLGVAQYGRTMPNTFVEGVDVSGLDAPSIRRVLAPLAEDRAQVRIRILALGERIDVDPVEVGLRADLDATARRALARGRGGPAGVVERLRAPWVRQDLGLIGGPDDELLAAYVDRLADRFDRPERVGDLVILGPREPIEILGPQGSITVDRTRTAARLRTALERLEDGQVDLSFRATPPPTSRAPIERLAAQVTSALEAPITLVHDTRRLTITPEVLAQLLDVDETVNAFGERVPTIVVDPIQLRTLVEPEARALFDRRAIDARLETPRDPPVTFDEKSSTRFAPVPVEVGLDPGRSTVRFDRTESAERIAQLVLTGQREGPAGVREVAAGFDGETAARGRPTHLLGTFTTYYTAGAARNLNIQRLADTIDDQLIAPGDTFSINATSGPRRCEDGYVLAGTIVRGELIDTCGGGVSQLGTTVYNAAFFAGLPTPQWQPHSYYISRYPMGREATLSFPELDVTFVNDTEGFLILRASYTATSVTVSIYGIPKYAGIRASHTPPRNPTNPSTLERATAALPPGARRVVQSGGGGFTVTVTRTFEPLADRTGAVPTDRDVPEPERITTVYRPQLRIVEVGITPPE